MKYFLPSSTLIYILTCFLSLFHTLSSNIAASRNPFQDLEDENVDVVFVKKRRSEYQSMFEDVKTVASICDDFVKQLRLFTEKQNIFNIEPRGRQKIIL